MNTIEVIGRMMLALGVVLVIMWLLAKWARKPLNGKSTQVLSVLARQQLSRGASVAIVQVADRALVLGISEQGVRLLAETDLSAIEAASGVSEVALGDGISVQSAPVKTLQLASRSVTKPAAAYLAGRVSHRANPRRRLPSAAPRLATESGTGGTGVKGPLDGSILSPQVWKHLMRGARDLTVRR